MKRWGNIIKFQMLQQTAGGCPTFTITPSGISNLTVGTPTTVTVSASGGTAPYSYSIVSGALPTGLSLNGSTGVISGTPTSAQNISFVIRATDAEGCTGNKTYTFDVICPTITISPSSISNLIAGQATTINLSSTGGTAPYTYTVTSGSLPTGLTLNGGTGVISGTPTTEGAASFQITSTDANTCTGIKSYSFNVNYEADAQAFITAAGITNTTQQQAINTLVVSLKGYGIWSKMKAIYPFVGGTASTHKWNLKDPRDLDAAFRLVFTGGWTHSATGAKGNGTNGFAETFLIPNTTLNINSQHLTYYNRSSLSGTYIDMGAFNTGYSVITSMQINMNGIYYGLINCSNASMELKYATTEFLGFYIISRTANNLMKSFRNGVNTGTNTVTIGTNNVITSIHINRRNNEGNYSPRECAFASIGDGLTDTEAANLYTLVQNYQVALNRQV